MPAGGSIIQALKGVSALPPYMYPLIPFGLAYSGLVRLRAKLYASGILPSRQLPYKTASVGNITAGGTGKTPMTVYVCELLIEMGHSPVVLTRGYGGSAEGRTLVVSDGMGNIVKPEVAGDEAVMLAGRLGGIPVVMGSDRYSAGMLAKSEFKVDVAVLDDGFQHIKLRRDINIALLDAQRPFGNGRTLPAGYLREPKSALRRANAIILTRSNKADTVTIERNTRLINETAPGVPVFISSHRPSRLFSLWEGEDFDMGTIRYAGIFWFCGLADPESFALILNELRVNITGFRVYPDHHRYTQSDLDNLESAALEAGASALITTEKDAVKLRGLKPTKIRLIVLGIDIAFDSEENKFKDILARAVG